MTLEFNNLENKDSQSKKAPPSPLTYEEAGVNRDLGDHFTKKIQSMTGKAYQDKVVSGVGGFSALYDLGDRYLASGTDGVGTKLKLAIDLNQHHTIGIDLVAMCANDVICSGAKPLFFHDYIATGKLDLKVSEEIIAGIIEGCHQCEMPLIGGETAEMPQFYPDGHYDLAGFCVGDVKKDQVIDGSKIKAGDLLIGLPSSGFHSNGFSLLRKFLTEEDTLLKKELLTPTKIYFKEISTLIEQLGDSIKGLAHITGSGLENISRMNPHFHYHITNVPKEGDLPLSIHLMLSRLNLDRKELYKTFNMGIGMVIATDRPHQVEKILEDLGSSPIFLGHVAKDDLQEKRDQVKYEFLSPLKK